MTTTYWNGHKWCEVAINDYETTGFLSLEQCLRILDSNDHRLAQFDDDPNRFLKKANAINQTLHDNEIPVGDRAGVMAALLLALAKNANLRIFLQPKQLFREINGCIEDLLKDHGKEDFKDVIKLTLPATEKNHQKYRKAVVETLQHLREMNIRSAINSGDDALGKFYETFLKYANGAKEMGIVLTPRHITKFAVDVIGINPNDRVFDPACGTGGFLISAMEEIRAKSPKKYDSFLNKGLFGIEQRDDVFGLAIVNMIFRKDGKSGIYDGNCFDHNFWLMGDQVSCTLPGQASPKNGIRPFNRVMMNPPFKLSSNDETKFVDYGLSQMRQDGLLFAVLPYVTLGGKKHSIWRQELIKRHTICAIIKLDKNLFYPVAEATYALILKAHRPHKLNNSVFMGILLDDYHRTRKSKILSKFHSVDNVKRMTDDLHSFLLNQPISQSLDREQCVTTLDLEADLDFSPEKYISRGSKPVDATYRALSAQALSKRVTLVTPKEIPETPTTKSFKLIAFIDKELKAPIRALKDYPPGSVPVVSATSDNNGVSEWLEIPDEQCLEKCITISKTHNTKPCEAFWHPYKFSALATALIVRPNKKLLENEFAIYYLCEAITVNNAWRYSYARPVRLDEIEVDVPVKGDGSPDFLAMKKIVEMQLS